MAQEIRGGVCSNFRRGEWEKATEARVKVWGFQSKLIDHRPNKLKGVSSEVLVCSLGNS
jgi:hypothetical protein